MSLEYPYWKESGSFYQEGLTEIVTFKQRSKEHEAAALVTPYVSVTKILERTT